MKVFVVDPSLYTSPYDEHFMQGLLDTGVEPVLFTRSYRAGEHLDLPASAVRHFFYRWADQGAPLLGKAGKGLEHIVDQRRFLHAVQRERPDVVHFQWSVMPLLDAGLFRNLRRQLPVVLTGHDTKAFNGAQTSRLQILGFDGIFRAASQVIVHTVSAAETLKARNVPGERISIIGHGPLSLKDAHTARTAPADDQWTVVAFGRIRAYKGLDVLVDAVSRMPKTLSAKLRCIIAGEPMMDMAPLIAQIEATGLRDCFDLRIRQHTDAEVSALMTEADCFVFPYLDIEASGVLYLVNDLRRWMIASSIGAFPEVILPDVTGELVPPGDPVALANALSRSVQQRPQPKEASRTITSWADIGRQTVDLYQTLIATERSKRRLEKRAS